MGTATARASTTAAPTAEATRVLPCQLICTGRWAHMSLTESEPSDLRLTPTTLQDLPAGDESMPLVGPRNQRQRLEVPCTPAGQAPSPLKVEARLRLPRAYPGQQGYRSTGAVEIKPPPARVTCSAVSPTLAPRPARHQDEEIGATGHTWDSAGVWLGNRDLPRGPRLPGRWPPLRARGGGSCHTLLCTPGALRAKADMAATLLSPALFWGWASCMPGSAS